MPALVEERRLITIVFADLSGFTSLSATLDPEEVREVANTCFEHLNKPLIHEGGMIHKYEGDLVIALFGFPAAHEDDPERAVRASLVMMQLVPKINETLAKKLKRKTELGLHVGINSGIVFVGEIGSSEKKEHTIMGDAVNLASRLKDLAKNGEIVVSEPVFRSSRYLFEYQASAPVPIKGVPDPVAVFKPLKLKERPEPKRGIKGLYSPMVGRDDEFRRLKEAVASVASGRSGVLFIIGDAGIGKSRLLDETRHSIADYNMPVAMLEARCSTYGETDAYFPFMQMLRSVFGIEARDSAESVGAKVLRRSEELFPEGSSEIAPYLGSMFSVRFGGDLDERIRHLEARQLKTQLHVSLKKLFARLAARRPIILVIDDYHWIDDESVALVRLLFEPPVAPGILLVALSRPERAKECFRMKDELKKMLGEGYQEITLKPLDARTASDLVYNLLNVPGITEGFKDRILAQAEGNPFYVEEIVRSLIDSGVLVYADGIWKLTAPVSSIEVPSNVHAVIATRLDRLERETREILQQASILGRSYLARVLESLSGVDSMMLTLYLATLEDFEYISELKRKPEREYGFRHPLLQEVAYNSLLKKHRRELHRKAAAVIEDAYPGRLDDFADLLAYQYANSDNVEKAIEWLKKAGHKAKDRYANREAIEHFRKLLDLVKESPDVLGGAAAVGEASEALGDIYTLIGQRDTALESYQEMERSGAGNILIRARAKRKIAALHQYAGRNDEALNMMLKLEKDMVGQSEGERLEQAEIGLVKYSVFEMRGEITRALDEIEKALGIADELLAHTVWDAARRRISQLKSLCFRKLGFTFSGRGEYDRAIEYYNKGMAIAQAIGDKFAVGQFLNNLGVVYKDKNQYDTALELFDKYLRISEEIGNKEGVGSAYINLGTVCMDTGDYDRAVELFEKHMAIAVEVGDRQGIGYANNNLGIVFRVRGDYPKAIEYYERYLQIAREIGSKSGVGTACSNLSSVYNDMGDYEKAIELATTHIKISEEVGDPIGQAAGRTNLAQAHKERGEYEKAQYLLEGALGICEKVGERQGVAIISVGLGDLFLTAKRLDRAHEHFRRAEKISDEIGDTVALVDICLGLAELRQIEHAGGFDPEAAGYLTKAMQFAEKIKSRADQARIHYISGRVWSIAGDGGEAMKHFAKALELFESLGQRKMVAETCLDYGHELAKNGRAEEAGPYLARARELFTGLGLAHRLKDI